MNQLTEKMAAALSKTHRQQSFKQICATVKKN